MHYLVLLIVFFNQLVYAKDGAGSSGGGFVFRGADKVLDQAIDEIIQDDLYKADPGLEKCANTLLAKKNLPAVNYREITDILQNHVQRLYAVERNRAVNGVDVPLFMDFTLDQSGNKQIDILKPFFIRYLGYDKLDRAQLDQIKQMLLHEVAHHFGALNDDDAETVAKEIKYVRDYETLSGGDRAYPPECR